MKRDTDHERTASSHSSPDAAEKRLKVVLDQVAGTIDTAEACERLRMDERAFDALKCRALAAVRDQTSQGVAEIQSVEVESQSRSWIECSPVCTKIVDLDLNLQYMSRSGIEALMIDDITEHYGHPYPLEFYPDSFKGTMRASLEEARRTGEVVSQEASVFDSEGNELWFHSTLVPVRDDQDQLAYIMVVSIETTERRQAEKALRESEENLRTTLYSIDDAVIAADMDGHISQLNPRAERLTGWTRLESEGAHLSEVFRVVNAETREVLESPIERVRASGQVVSRDRHSTLISKDGTEHEISDSAAPLRDASGAVTGIVLVFRDVTAEMRIQEELQQMQRLESLGSLAGGIAHDFNNVLMGVFSNISLAREDLSAEHPAFHWISQAERSLTRAVRLTKQLLTFSKGGEPVKGSVGIGDLIEEVARFDLAGSNVQLVFEATEDLWDAYADAGQLQQVFWNLVINADHAMSEGGHLFITLENAEGPTPGLEAGKYIKITVRDEGPGIGQQTLGRIFDPFFTTKATGSGLGLATCYSIISKHGGHIGVESRLGSGTSFTIYLRASEVPRTPSVLGSAWESWATDVAPRVLIMDDDDAVREVTACILQRLDCVVEEATEGTEAIRMYEEAAAAGQPFDTAIMDLTIPGGMGGRAAAQEILKLDPEAILIASSGYAGDSAIADFEGAGFRGAIAKPFSPKQLQEVVIRALGAVDSRA